MSSPEMGSELDAEKIGVTVRCIVCRRTKCPRGRSAPAELVMCTGECAGYAMEPRVGDLWPRESEADFGYPCTNDGTTKAAPPEKEKP